MIPPPGGRITFLEVVQKTRYKYLYALALVLLLVGILASQVLTSLSPVGLSGTTQAARPVFEVKESTDGAVILVVSHTFDLQAADYHYRVVNGPPTVDYTATITSGNGAELYNWSYAIDLPFIISDYGGGQTYTKEDTTELDLPVGIYTLALTADHPVDYKLSQKNKLQLQLMSMELVAFMGILLLGLSVVMTLNTRKALRTSQALGAMSIPSGTAGYSGGRPMYRPTTYTAYDPDASSYIEEKEAYEFICARCGNVIRNPVIQNVIICERCGEREYVG